MKKQNESIVYNSNNDHQYNAIDIFKFICSILICTIHIPIFSNNTIPYATVINFYFKNCLSRIAVPFYFTTAGFFLFKKININNIDYKIIKDYCFKILRLLGTWSAIIIIGNKDHLWYLGALVNAILIISFLFKKNIKLKYIIIITIFLFTIGLLGDTYYQIIKPLKNNFLLSNIIEIYETFFKTTRNGLFFGTTFILIGSIFATKKIKINFKAAYLGTLISFFLLVFETFLLMNYSKPKDYNIFLSLIPLTFFSFYMLMNIKLKNKPIYKKLRIISILIYFSHPLFIYISNLIIKSINTKTNIDLINYQFLLVIILTLSFSIVIEKISQKEKFKLFKYLYS